ncbi:hypothetical protein [Cardiobacterium hominis]|uniref:hypothetical protein n=1 Tax=Cardiobacterium hominis TaxID=2718 RepID=UPI0009A71151|nr:hypothetical protein [Cardiobacterium hominis]
MRYSALLFYWELPLAFAIWLFCGGLIFFYINRPDYAIDKAFSICAFVDGQPRLLPLATPESWQDKTLCREALQFEEWHEEGEIMQRLIVTRERDTIFIKQYTGRTHDPREFAYRIDDSTNPPTIIPLWWRYAAILKRMVAAFAALPFTVILYRILRGMIVRRFYREGSDDSTNDTD